MEQPKYFTSPLLSSQPQRLRKMMCFHPSWELFSAVRAKKCYCIKQGAPPALPSLAAKKLSEVTVPALGSRQQSAVHPLLSWGHSRQNSVA